jgi:hypothetical protein
LSASSFWVARASYLNIKVKEQLMVIYWLTLWMSRILGQSILCHIQLRLITHTHRPSWWHGYYFWQSYSNLTPSPGRLKLISYLSNRREAYSDLLTYHVDVQDSRSVHIQLRMLNRPSQWHGYYFW